MRYIGGTFRNVSKADVSISRSYGLTSLTTLRTSSSVYDIETSVVKLRERLRTEISVLNYLSEVTYSKNLSELSETEIKNVINSSSFQPFRTVYSEFFGKFLSGIELYSVLYKSLSQSQPQSDVHRNSVVNVISSTFAIPDELISTLKHSLLRYDTSTTNNQYVKTDDVSYIDTSIQFNQLQRDVSYLLQLHNVPELSSTFYDESIYVVSNYDENYDRVVQLSRYYSNNDHETLYSKKYDNVDYKKEIFGLRNNHIIGYYDRKIENSFLVTVDSWLQKIKVFKYSSNDWIVDEQLSSLLTEKYYNKYIYDSDTVICFHMFDRYGVLILLEETGNGPYQCSEIQLSTNISTNFTNVVSTVVRNNKFEPSRSNSDRRRFKLIIFTKDELQVKYVTYLDNITSHMYPYLVPYVINLGTKLVILNALPTTERSNRWIVYRRWDDFSGKWFYGTCRVIDLDVKITDKKFDIRLSEDGSMFSTYIIPFRSTKVLVINLSKDVISELIQNTPNLVDHSSFKYNVIPQSVDQITQSIYPDPLYYSCSIKENSTTSNRITVNVSSYNYNQLQSNYESYSYLHSRNRVTSSSRWTCIENRNQQVNNDSLVVNSISNSRKNIWYQFTTWSSLGHRWYRDFEANRWYMYSTWNDFHGRWRRVTNAYFISSSNTFGKLFQLDLSTNRYRNLSYTKYTSSISFNISNQHTSSLHDLYFYDTVNIVDVSLQTNKVSHEVTGKIYSGRTFVPGPIKNITLTDLLSQNVGIQQLPTHTKTFLTTLLQNTNEPIDIILRYGIIDNVASKTSMMFLKSIAPLSYFFTIHNFDELFFNYNLQLPTTSSTVRNTVESLHNKYITTFHRRENTYYNLPYSDFISIITKLSSEYEPVNLEQSTGRKLLQDFASIVGDVDYLSYLVSDSNILYGVEKTLIPAYSVLDLGNRNDLTINRSSDDVTIVEDHDVNIQDGYSSVPTDSFFIRESVSFTQL